MTSDKIKMARQLYRANELTVEEIAKTIGVSRKTVYRHLVPNPT
jgi:DNA-binding XRE family transcriptional regulator